MGNSTCGEDSDKPIIPATIAVIGDTKVGKSSLITQYVDGRFVDVNPFFAVRNKLYALDHCYAQLQIHDLCEASSPIEEARGVIFVFDLMQKDTLRSINKWCKETMKYNSSYQCILVGTKYDLFHAMNDVYKRDIANSARRMAHAMGSPFIMCSAKTSVHVDETFELMVACMFAQINKLHLEQKRNERLQPILEYKTRNNRNYDGAALYPFELTQLLHPTQHINKLITIHENGHVDNRDMIESDGEDNDSVISVEDDLYMDDLEEWISSDDENRPDHNVQCGVTMMGMTTKDEVEEGDAKVQHETLLGYTQEGDGDEDGMRIKTQAITLMGDGTSGFDSEDDNVFESLNVTLMGVAWKLKEKLKFIQYKL
eukprot:240100_1